MGRPKKNENRGYKGNELLKRVDMQIEWTEELLQEYTKCATDIEYFIEKYVYIDSLDDGLVKFKLRDYQHKMIDSIVNNRYTIMLASRQIGKCCHVDSNITIKNKVTNKIETISIGDFYKRHFLYINIIHFIL
jgi:hypothetical protein